MILLGSPGPGGNAGTNGGVGGNTLFGSLMTAFGGYGGGGGASGPWTSFTNTVLRLLV